MAAFLVDGATTPRRFSSSDFTREQEEEGIRFTVENATEDLINGLFCTYEPPTSKKQQYKAAKAFRENPKKFSKRPHVPKSILKWKVATPKAAAAPQGKPSSSSQEPPPPKQSEPLPLPSAMKKNTTTEETTTKTASAAVVPTTTTSTNTQQQAIVEKKSVRWRDQQSRENRTEIENTVVELASKYCGGACNHGEDIADILSSPQGRAAQTFFGGPDTPGSMANMATDMATDMASNFFGGGQASTEQEDQQPPNKKVFYDDQGNPILEDEVSNHSHSSYFPSTPKEGPTTPSSVSSRQSKLEGRSNLFCSNLPFMDTVMTGIGIAGIAAASAAVKAGVPEEYCFVPTTQGYKRAARAAKEAQREEISKDLQNAQDALGIYEPEHYSEGSSSIKLKRQSTPKHTRLRRTGTPRYASSSSPSSGAEDTRHEQEDDHDDRESQRDGGNPYSTYATSDITMGNTTIKHFGGAASLAGTARADASLFDADTTTEDETTTTTTTASGKRSSSLASLFSKKSSKKNGGFSSMVEELKHVQQLRKEQRLAGSSQYSEVSSSKKSNTSSKIHKSHTTTTTAAAAAEAQVSLADIKKDYEKSCKSPRPSVATTSYLNSLKKSPVNSVLTNAPPTPNQDRVEAAKMFEERGGTVANLAKQFESPRSIYGATPPPRKSIDPIESRFFDGKVDLLPPTPRRNKSTTTTTTTTPTGYSMTKGSKLQMHDWGTTTTKTPVSIQTDAEIRESASTILDVHVTTNTTPTQLRRRRPKSLVKGPETVEADEAEDPPAHSPPSQKTKKTKKSFASKLKKSMEKALHPVKKATEKMEKDRLGNC